MTWRAVVCTGTTAEAAKLAARVYADRPGAECIEGDVADFEFRNGAGVTAEMDHLRANSATSDIHVVMVLYDDRRA